MTDQCVGDNSTEAQGRLSSSPARLPNNSSNSSRHSNRSTPIYPVWRHEAILIVARGRSEESAHAKSVVKVESAVYYSPTLYYGNLRVCVAPYAKAKTV